MPFPHRLPRLYTLGLPLVIAVTVLLLGGAPAQAKPSNYVIDKVRITLSIEGIRQ